LTFFFPFLPSSKLKEERKDPLGTPLANPQVDEPEPLDNPLDTTNPALQSSSKWKSSMAPDLYNRAGGRQFVSFSLLAGLGTNRLESRNIL
jgi:hypothetical protein